MRLFALADSDLLTDRFLARVPANSYMIPDVLKWLVGEEKYAGETTSEEDVRLLHTRKEDQLWFYLTIFAMPALVFGGGLFYTRRRRNK